MPKPKNSPRKPKCLQNILNTPWFLKERANRLNALYREMLVKIYGETTQTDDEIKLEIAWMKENVIKYDTVYNMSYYALKNEAEKIKNSDVIIKEQERKKSASKKVLELRRQTLDEYSFQVNRALSMWEHILKKHPDVDKANQLPNHELQRLLEFDHIDLAKFMRGKIELCAK